MTNVVQFRPRGAYPTPGREPTITIEIYDNGHDAGFTWTARSANEQMIGHDALQDYVGDMFLSMCPDSPSGIRSRLSAFLTRLNRFSDAVVAFGRPRRLDTQGDDQ